MFWGIVLENGKRYTQVVDDGFHISMAALEPLADKKKDNGTPVSVMMEREKTEFLLCTLSHEKRPQQPLDLNFAEGEAVTLFLNGDGIVHLTGYVIEAEPEDQEYSYGEEGEDVSEDESDDLETLKRKSKGLNEKASKKQKVDSSDDELSSLDDLDSDDSDDDEKLMLKNKQLSPKKSAIKPAAVGAPLNNKQSSVSPPKKVTIMASPKSESSPQASPPSPVYAEKTKKQKKGAQTPVANGEKSLDESLSGSAKKKRKRNKIKGGSQGESTPKADSEKTPVKGQNKAEKTPGKGQNKAEKTPGKGQNDAEKTPGKAQKKLPSGVAIQDLQVGHGPEAKQGKMVHMYYIGKLANNKEFDSCVKGQQPFKFRLGKGEVIKGWDDGILGMKVGGRRKLVIPPKQGYGKKSVGPIPPNSTLNFEVQLVSVS